MANKCNLSIENLHKSYGKKSVLAGVSLQVYAGEIFGFIGKNGIGKSTTIDCAIGLKHFERGSISICGHNIVSNSMEAKRCYGYVASEPCCYENMTGFGYLHFIGNIYRIEKQQFDERLENLLARLDFKKSDLKKLISEYSHGTMQKICLIASLLHDPEVWILDEPTVGLDIMTVEALKNIMKERAQNNKTVFFTSHNIEFVSTLCDRVAIINDGKVIALYDLRREPQVRQRLSQIFFNINGETDV